MSWDDIDREPEPTFPGPAVPNRGETPTTPLALTTLTTLTTLGERIRGVLVAHGTGGRDVDYTASRIERIFSDCLLTHLSALADAVEDGGTR